MTSTVIVEEIQILVPAVEEQMLVDEVRSFEILTAGEQGPPGPVGNADGALLVANRLNEFDDEAKRIAARTNLGLQNIDGGTFF
jgi:hypothetical protein